MMEKRHHIPDREACPHLPMVEGVICPRDIAAVRRAGGADAYMAALRCAQSLWLQGLPAQALLQTNHAMSHDFGNDTPPWSMPYDALVWILSRRHEIGFMGNPVRHFQHLATRMSGPDKELRISRAWVCFHLAEKVLPLEKFPRDQRQIEKESLSIPDANEAVEMLASGAEREVVQRLLF